MANKKAKLSVTLLLSVGISIGYSQEVANTSGGDASGTGGSVAYSVGQVVYTSVTGTTGSINQGVQQPYEIFLVGVKGTEMNISFLVFPNPTLDNLSLVVQDYNDEKLVYKLFDMQGRLIESKSVTASQTQINAVGLPAATYFLSIHREKEIVQTFKIIKH